MSSVSFERSHQHVGLNRVGVYYKPVPEKGPGGAGVQPASHSGKQAGGTPAPHNEPWRRWTGIVGGDANRLTWKQRKRGIRRLLKKIEIRIAAGLEKQFSIETPKCGVRNGWGGDLDGWARPLSAGRSLESICVEFGIARGQLNALTREYSSLSAQDVIDGYKLGGLKKLLMGQLREAAFGLWGGPGDFARRRCIIQGSASYVDESVPHHAAQRSGVPRRPKRTQHATALRSVAWHTTTGDIANCTQGLSGRQAPKRSKYFRTRPSEFFGLLPGDEERIRTSELLGKLDALRDENDWHGENLAIQLGFENASALKRACLNVMGRKLEQLERILAREIVEYYLAAEDRELRELARRDPGRQECHLVGAKSPDHCIYAAREIYCGDAEIVPEEPFLDRWSANEFARPEWLAAMRREFG